MVLQISTNYAKVCGCFDKKKVNRRTYFFLANVNVTIREEHSGGRKQRKQLELL